MRVEEGGTDVLGPVPETDAAGVLANDLCGTGPERPPGVLSLRGGVLEKLADTALREGGGAAQDDEAERAEAQHEWQSRRSSSSRGHGDEPNADEGADEGPA